MSRTPLPYWAEMEFQVSFDRRGRVALVLGVGDEMKPEWESPVMTQTARRAVSATIPYLDGNELSIIYYGTGVDVRQPVSVVDFVASGLLDRPDLGPGANLTGALHGALSQRQDGEMMTIIIMADMNIGEAALAGAKHIVSSSSNLAVVIVRTATDSDGEEQAHELDSFATNDGNYDKVELVHTTDGRGRRIDHNLETCITRRLAKIHGQLDQHELDTQRRLSAPATV